MAHLPSFIHPRDPSVDRRFRPCPERQINLFSSLYEEEETETENSSESVASSNTSAPVTKEKTEKAQVYLRLRPTEESSYCYSIANNVLISTAPDSSVGSNAGKNFLEKQFTFTDIFHGGVSQTTVYETCVERYIEEQENLTVLTYGTSGSGKTFTLLGDLDKPGIIPRALEHLFSLYKDNIYQDPAVKFVNGTITLVDDDSAKKEEKLRLIFLEPNNEINDYHSKVQSLIQTSHNFKTVSLTNKSIFIWISFAEIYNEQVYDLLSPTLEQDLKKKKHLKILSDQDGSYIKGLTSIYVKNSREAYTLLLTGLKRVNYASTIINSHSSRSHCLFFIDVLTFSQPDIFTHSTYKFCDLAGSERLKKTKNVGHRLKEAQLINTSLLVLGRCLDAVHSNQQKKGTDVIPFRDSKLTMMLKAPLLGKEKITMIVSLLPTKDYFEENLNVLGFSSIAKNITFKPVQKQIRKKRYSFLMASITSPQNTISYREYNTIMEENTNLKLEMERLIEENSELEKQLIRNEIAIRNELVNSFENNLKESNQLWEKRFQQQKVSLETMYRANIRALEAKCNRLEAGDDDDEDDDDEESESSDDDVMEVKA